MSSTNRTNAKARHVSDYYVTPVDDIKRFLDAFQADWQLFKFESSVDPFSQPVTVLDPCAGGDGQHEMSYPTALSKYSQWDIMDIETVDVRDDSLARHKEDFLFRPCPIEKFDIAITNPPFNIALDVIQKCMREVRGGGGMSSCCCGSIFSAARNGAHGSRAICPWSAMCIPNASSSPILAARTASSICTRYGASGKPTILPN